MTPDQAARLAALVSAIDDTAAEHIAELDPAIALAVSVIVGQGRSDPEWLIDQSHRVMAVAAAILAYVDDGRLTATAALPALVAEAIVRAAESIHEGAPA